MAGVAWPTRRTNSLSFKSSCRCFTVQINFGHDTDPNLLRRCSTTDNRHRHRHGKGSQATAAYDTALSTGLNRQQRPLFIHDPLCSARLTLTAAAAAADVCRMCRHFSIFALPAWLPSCCTGSCLLSPTPHSYTHTHRATPAPPHP